MSDYDLDNPPSLDSLDNCELSETEYDKLEEIYDENSQDSFQTSTSSEYGIKMKNVKYDSYSKMAKFFTPKIRFNTDSIDKIIQEIKNGDYAKASLLPSNIRKLLIDLCVANIQSDSFSESQKQQFKNILENIDCKSRNKISLKAYQKQAVNFFDTHKSLFLCFATGTGKTATAVSISECYLDSNINNFVIVTCPKSVKETFSRELNKYGVSKEVMSLKYIIMSYTEFQHMFNSDDEYFLSILKQSLLIIDEVHNFKNSSGLGSEVMVKAGILCDKILILSATPFINNLSDFFVIINLLHKEIKVKRKMKFAPLKYDGITYLNVSFNSRDIIENPYKYIELFNESYVPFLNKRLLYVDNDKLDMKYFPDHTLYRVYIPMNKEYEKSYFSNASKDLFGNVTEAEKQAFWCVYRNTVNKISADDENNYLSEKVKYLIKHLDLNAKTAIYTNWIANGLDIIKSIFDQQGVKKYGILYAKTSVENKQIIDDYNSNKLNIIVYSAANSEGVSFFETRKLYILEPTWTRADMDQIVGRVIRYASHMQLSEHQRHVDIYQLLLVESYLLDNPYVYDVSRDEGEETFKGKIVNSLSGDVILYKFVDGKSKFTTLIGERLKQLSI